MKPKNRTMWMTLGVFVALTVSALRVIPVYADGPAPTEEQPVEVSAPPEGEPGQVPEGTEVVVVDENGEALPLATQAAAEAIVEKDPVWCPAGVAPKPNMGGCSPSFGSLSALVTGGGTPGGNGTIWIEAGNDSGVEVVINGAGTWAPAKNYSLTLQGGWSGVSGSKAIVGVSVFDTGINIVNWNGAVTIKDIAMVNASNVNYPSTGALNVETTKNIVLSGFTSSGTGGGSTDGAYLDNTSSTGQSSVTIKNSSFNDNTFRGLSVYSDGAITLTNVNANDNGTSRGVSLSNIADTASSPVTVTGGSFQSNVTYGLYIQSNGAVKLTNIVTSWNGSDGMYVDNTFASTAQSVTVGGFYAGQFNSGNGLKILSDGKVSLSNITTNNNTMRGTTITNSSAATPLGVTFTGNNQFVGNGEEGLFISTRGAVALNNVTANDNGWTIEKYGVYVINDFDSTKPQNVTFSGVNVFNGNGYHGLYITTYGVVTLNNVTANNNGEKVNDTYGMGVLIGAGGGTIAKPVIFKGTNVFNNNDGNGLHVATLGAITVSNITASNNGNYGAYIYNAYGIQSPVTLVGYGNFLSNGSTGLVVDSNGSVSTTNLTASLNGDDGVSINTIGVTAPQTVSIKGNNWFLWNGNAGTDSGLKVYADGKITANNLNATSNYYNGAFLDNKTNWLAGSFASFGSITLTGSHSFTYNSIGAGLWVATHGTVALSNIHSDFNTNNTGISITSDGNVTLSCIFTNNNSWGLWMYTTVNLLTIKGLYAFDNSIVNEHLAATTINRSGCP